MDNESAKKLEVFLISGVVVEVVKDSETIVSGHGGEGRIHTLATGHVEGYTSGISIGSATLKKTTVWIRTEEEQEIDIAFDGEVKTREGHKVTFVCVRDTRTGSIVVSKLINRTTNTNTTFISKKMLPLSFGYGNTLAREPYKLNLVKSIFLILFISFAIQGVLPQPDWISFVAWSVIVAIPVAVYKIIKRRSWKKKDRSLAGENEEIDSLYKQICYDLDMQFQKLEVA